MKSKSVLQPWKICKTFVRARTVLSPSDVIAVIQ
jgi:hypothetical protein